MLVVIATDWTCSIYHAITTTDGPSILKCEFIVSTVIKWQHARSWLVVITLYISDHET
jgi:hypothetical protein